MLAALSSEAVKDVRRVAVADWMGDRPNALLSLLGMGVCEDTVENHAKDALPSLTFLDYCAVMQLPLVLGGSVVNAWRPASMPT